MVCSSSQRLRSLNVLVLPKLTDDSNRNLSMLLGGQVRRLDKMILKFVWKKKPEQPNIPEESGPDCGY